VAVSFEGVILSRPPTWSDLMSFLLLGDLKVSRSKWFSDRLLCDFLSMHPTLLQYLHTLESFLSVEVWVYGHFINFFDKCMLRPAGGQHSTRNILSGKRQIWVVCSLRVLLTLVDIYKWIWANTLLKGFTLHTSSLANRWENVLPSTTKGSWSRDGAICLLLFISIYHSLSTRQKSTGY